MAALNEYIVQMDYLYISTYAKNNSLADLR